MVAISDGDSEMIAINHAYANEVATECYVVVACLGDGKLMYHEGPLTYAYFSKDQAKGLVAELNSYKLIDPAFFNDGSFPDMTIRDLEDNF